MKNKDILDEIHDQYRATGTIKTVSLNTPSRARALVGNWSARLLHYCLRRVSLSQLDKALTAKLGKPASKSRIVREKAKSYNEGAQDMIRELKKRGFWV